MSLGKSTRRISAVFKQMRRYREWKNEVHLGKVHPYCRGWPSAEYAEAG